MMERGFTVRGTALLGALLFGLVMVADGLHGRVAAQVLGQAGPKATPFGLSGPAPTSGVTGFILAKQAQFYRALIQAVRAAKADGHAIGMLAGLSFLYGMFHAAGPGHGKAVISSYLLADGGTLRRGIALSFASAFVQASAAVLFVGVLALVLGATAVAMAQAMNLLEIAAYGGIALFGAYLAVTKAWALIALMRGSAPSHAHDADCGCTQSHVPDPVLLQGPGGGWRRAMIAVVSAGARPCSGAILVLTFALSQGVPASGVAAVFAMGIGTALTVSAIAILAVYGKRVAVKVAGFGGERSIVLLRMVELMAALLVMGFGFALLTGYMASERLLPG